MQSDNNIGTDNTPPTKLTPEWKADAAALIDALRAKWPNGLMGVSGPDIETTLWLRQRAIPRVLDTNRMLTLDDFASKKVNSHAVS